MGVSERFAPAGMIYDEEVGATFAWFGEVGPKPVARTEVLLDGAVSFEFDEDERLLGMVFRMPQDEAVDLILNALRGKSR